MEKINKYYECLFVVDVTDGDEAVKATVEKFVGIINANAETVVEVAQWGKRRLAYPINDKPEGYYVVATFKSRRRVRPRRGGRTGGSRRRGCRRGTGRRVTAVVSPRARNHPGEGRPHPPRCGGYGQRSLRTSPAQAAERPEVSERYPAAVHRNRQPSGKEKPYVS